MISGCSVHPIGACGNSPKNIAATDNDSGLDAKINAGLNLPGHVLYHIRTDAKILVTH
jgi:hypothetical protein